MQPIIEARELDFTYPGGNEALRGVNLKIFGGCTTALIGSNGSGKTTLLQQLNGLLKPREGEVFLKGRLLTSYRPAEIFQTVGMVFQDPDDQLFATTVFEDVSYAPTNLKLARDEIIERVNQALAIMGIGELRDQRINRLSYGQKKRVAIAGILALKPEVLVLDEPTAGLDPLTASRLMKTLQKLKERGVAVVLATHDLDLVPVYCQELVVMDQGRIVARGTPDKVFEDRALIRSANLRLPRVNHLLEILADRDGFDLEPALTIGQARKSLQKRFLRQSPK